MSDLLFILLSVFVGLLTGLFFFGGLWWTVKKGVGSHVPALWFIGSLLIRLVVTLVVFYYLSVDHWERLLLCLLGFIVARGFVSRLTLKVKVKHLVKTQPL